MLAFAPNKAADPVYLFRLIDYSKNATLNPDDPHVRADLKAILEAAKCNNMANGITGALLFNQNYFAQVLEGDRRALPAANLHHLLFANEYSLLGMVYCAG